MGDTGTTEPYEVIPAEEPILLDSMRHYLIRLIKIIMGTSGFHERSIGCETYATFHSVPASGSHICK